MKNKIKVLMISSTGLIGGGPIQMFILSRQLSYKAKFYFAMPKSRFFEEDLKGTNNIFIKERKISLRDIKRIVKSWIEVNLIIGFISIIHTTFLL